MRHKKQKTRGQAVVEYLLLLLVAIFAIGTIFQLDETLRDKIIVIANDLIDKEPGLPSEDREEIETDKLSPPVADFTIPEPNYKGRDVKLVDRSFDLDGYIEHYIWTVDGKEIRQTREEVERKNGMIVNFRYSGTYDISLMVIDNDGLVSNRVTKQITIENRRPTISITAKSHLGNTATDGGTITVHQYCEAEFFTTYEDEDLPYEVLELYSKFTDSTGVVSEYDTIPYQFSRPFENAGMNEYYVRVRDEDGAVADADVNIRVIANPDPNAMAQKRCTAPPPKPPDQSNDKKPTFQINVEGHVSVDNSTNPRTYYFLPNTSATINGQLTMGDHPEHNEGRYWATTDFSNNGNKWSPKSNWGTIVRPTGGVTFTPDTPPITITGMGRDTTAISTEPNPSLAGMSNLDSVVLKVKCPTPDELKPGQANPCAVEPSAIISVNDKSLTPTAEEILNLQVGVKPSTDFRCDAKQCMLQINSRHSKSNSGGEIKGVRYKINGQWYPNSTNPSSNFGKTNITEFTDQNGNKEYWFQGKPDSPDTDIPLGKSFKIGDGLGALKDRFTYELRVIDTNNMANVKPVKKTIILKDKINPPFANCKNRKDGSKIITVEQGTPFMEFVSAAASKDSKGGQEITVDYLSDKGQVLGKTPTEVIKNDWSYSSVKEYPIQVVVKEKNGGLTATDTCTIKVIPKKELAPMKLEIWYIEDRVERSGKSITALNKTTPKNVVAPTDGIGFQFSTYSDAAHISGSGRTGLISNSTDRSAQIVIPRSSSVAGAIVTSIYATNVDGKDVCTNSSYQNMTFPSDTKKRRFCRKDAWYARTIPSTITRTNPTTLREEQCTIYTITKTGYKTFQSYLDRFPFLPNEYSGDYHVTDDVKRELSPKSCKAIGGGGGGGGGGMLPKSIE